MPASKAEQVLDALKALLETVPDAVRHAKSFVSTALEAGYRAGRGRFLGLPRA